MTLEMRTGPAVRRAAVVVAYLLLLAVSADRVRAQAPVRGFPADALAQLHTLDGIVRDAPDTARIRQMIREMTRVPHAAGTPGSKRVAEWILGQFKSFGLDAKIETYEPLIPLPLEQTLEIVGPRPWKARLKEEVFAEDPDSKLPGILPPYAGWSRDGEVTAPVIYANYALPEDFAQLVKMGIDVRGSIILARGGPHNRTVKWEQAAKFGAVGLITYNDPKEDGFWLNRPYPRGPMRPPHAVERGAIRAELQGTGDPLTPGWAAKPGAKRLALNDPAVGLSTIPVLSISYADASALFDVLEGPVVPNDAWKGALGLTYHVGPSKAKVHMKVRSEWKNRPIYNVIARIPGTVHPDEWIITGNHHDAWVYGADDPVGAAAAVMETARVLGNLKKNGWTPDRTIIFAMWDGEELGLLGSTEWAEDHADELRAKAVAYLNGDNYRRGALTASGSGVMETFMREVFRDTPDPVTGRSALDISRDRAVAAARTASDTAAARERGVFLTPLGSNTDYGAFIQHLGITSMHIAYRNVGRGTYHSVFDSYAYFARFLDPDFSYGRSQAGVFASALLRLADAPVLPWSFSDDAKYLRPWAMEVAALATRQKADVNLDPVLAAIDSLAAASARYDAALQRALSRGASVLAANGAALTALNRGIATSERTLLFPAGVPDRPWYAYPISAGSAYNGSVARTLPYVREPIELGDFASARTQADALTASLQRFTARVRDLTKQLDAIH
jgi:N-acetylated-alpha-linked acidic dipeptidase